MAGCHWCYGGVSRPIALRLIKLTGGEVGRLTEQLINMSTPAARP